MKPFIQFKDFTFKYDVQAEPTLKAIDLTIEKGQKVLIVGASGSGKSTIGHCLNGIIPNIHQGEKIGQLLIDGQDDRSEERRVGTDGTNTRERNDYTNK